MSELNESKKKEYIFNLIEELDLGRGVEFGTLINKVSNSYMESELDDILFELAYDGCLYQPRPDVYKILDSEPVSQTSNRVKEKSTKKEKNKMSAENKFNTVGWTNGKFNKRISVFTQQNGQYLNYGLTAFGDVRATKLGDSISIQLTSKALDKLIHDLTELKEQISS